MDKKNAVIGGTKMTTETVYREFVSRAGHTVQLWALYYGPRVCSLSFSESPFWNMETVTLQREVA